MEIIEGKEAAILFEAKRCIHSRQCVLGRPDVFVPNVEGEWIHPDAATKEEIAALAESCPSGAIRYKWKNKSTGKDSDVEKLPLVNVARVRENGPIALHAEMDIVGVGKLNRATLCRCGASQNKPFCDGNHSTVAFSATGEPLTKPSEPLANRQGNLNINPVTNGPLLLDGSIEITSGTGRTINRVTKTALCRCGASQNKPYCDGTHSKIGFKS